MSRQWTNELEWYDEPTEYISRNGGFSGCDIDIVVRLPGVYDRRGNTLEPPRVFQLGSLQTLSYQSYNSKEAVRALGFKNVKGYGRGSRTIAGTLMFNQLYTHVLDDLGNKTIVEDRKGILTYSSGKVRYYRNAPIDPKIQQAVGADWGEIESPSVVRKRHNFDFSWDQKTIGSQLKSADLPPFDIIALFVNEYGHIGKMVIYGVDLITEGGVLSVEDIYTEVSMQYVARDIEFFHARTSSEVSQWSGSSPYAADRGDLAKEIRINNSVNAAQDAVFFANQRYGHNQAVSNAMRDIGFARAVSQDRQDIIRTIDRQGVSLENNPYGGKVGFSGQSNNYTQQEMNSISRIRNLPISLLEDDTGRTRVENEINSILNSMTNRTLLTNALNLERQRALNSNPNYSSIDRPIDIRMVEYCLRYLGGL